MIDPGFFTRLRPAMLAPVMLAAPFLLGGCDKPPEAPAPEAVRPVKAMVIAGAAGERTRSLPGKVRAAERVDLAFQVAGPLIELPVKQGELVEQGALIGRIDPRDFRSNLNAAQADYDKAKANFERAEELIKKDFISKSDYDRLKAQEQVAESNLEKARKALGDTELNAPFSGRIARRYVENFQDVNAKQPIVSLQDISQVEIVINVPERLLLRGADQSRVSLTASFEGAPDRTFDLEVKEFSTEADPETQTFEYVLVMPQPEDVNILPGMTATVTSISAARVGELVIPLVAVAAGATGQAVVWVINPDGTVQKRQVKTGRLTGSDSIYITEGLAPGEQIAVSGVSSLREGMKVRPVEKLEF